MTELGALPMAQSVYVNQHEKVSTDFDTVLDVATLEHLFEVAKSNYLALRETGYEELAIHWHRNMVWIAKTIVIAHGQNPYENYEWQSRVNI